ncbi:NAD(P)/FAD-dependent oxidoreductase [Nocardia sp. alder85J]|uniref:NAD(P)/FAD-dependent oxidoreductase n=1 Tax=Nocardia sp. alder85J TaxID=2862949 RepID=UPI001CD7D064|nr:FAD-dependent oxidoreductase [Nocardia sp. alder85J]MCX4092869.1 FAD-dependent oxidoreductase [Nocardia sp. alder85J]
MSTTIDVAVLGGGYAGVLAANRLTARADVTVTLINPRPMFVQRVRLHQLAGGTHDAVTGYHDILADRVRLVVGTATGIDAAARHVTLGAGATVGYDHLVYAVGSTSATVTVPGAADHTHPLATYEQAQRLHAALDAAGPGAPVVVVGAGATGIEIAAELAERGHRVTLVCGRVLGPALHPRVRRSITARLTALGVIVLDGPDAVVTAVTGDTVHLSGGHTLRNTLTVWTAGFGVPDLAARSGLTTDAAGRLCTDETLTSVDDPHIVAAGDAAAPSGQPLRMSCQTARPLGAHAADTVLAHLAGTPAPTLDIGYFGQCIGLGRHAATVQLATRADTATRFSLGGRLAAGIKERACRGVVRELADEARDPGTFTWSFGNPARRRLLHPTPAQPATH